MQLLALSISLHTIYAVTFLWLFSNSAQTAKSRKLCQRGVDVAQTNFVWEFKNMAPSSEM